MYYNAHFCLQGKCRYKPCAFCNNLKNFLKKFLPACNWICFYIQLCSRSCLLCFASMRFCKVLEEQSIFVLPVLQSKLSVRAGRRFMFANTRRVYRFFFFTFDYLLIAATTFPLASVSHVAKVDHGEILMIIW